jgi:3-hydroxyacyl-CoA dehydrogenase
VKDHAQLLDQWRSRLAKKSRGQIAPQKAIQSIENSLLMAFSQALRKERELFIECRNSPQSAAMRHAFFAERQASKVKDLNDDIVAPEINSVAVIGAGTMGTAIAMCFANAHIQVTLLELNKTQLQKGLDRITSRYQQSVKRGRITPEAFKRHMACISTTCDYQDLADADLVVEAAFESMDVKKTIFKQLDQICKPEAILASNTSYLDIDTIARVTTRPANIIGLHFFSPADIMKLLEIVRAEKTSSQAIKTAVTLAKRIKKIPVVVGNAYGFVGNAMYASYGREAQMLLLEGATPEQVDKAMTDWGMAMGPFAVNDLSGIDIAYKARRENPHLPDDPCYFRPADLMVEAGRLGQKTGAGFYHYSAATGERQPDPDAINIIRTEAIKLGVPQRQNIADTEIQQRLVMALINQGNTLLEQGIATRASDIDVIWLNGYGFPRFRGGPMCYANEMSLLD